MSLLRQTQGSGVGLLAVAALLLTTAAAWGAATPPATAGNGCGSSAAQYSVVTDSAVPGNPPKATGSRIIVFQTGQSVVSDSQVYRVGIDGRWTGALGDFSWQLFPVAPGLHHLCVNWQSPVKSLSSQTATAVVQAQPGKSSYVELSVAGAAGKVASFYLFGVTPGEGSSVVSSLPHAVSLARRPPPHLLR